MMKPMWFDELIETVIGTGDPAVIAQTIAKSPQFMDAIKRGLANKPKPGVAGPSYAQVVAQEVRKAMAAV